MDTIQEAKKLFNETWDLLDKQNRTDADNITMLHKAHTSCFLWRSAENPVNDERGEWQVSRVYSVLGYGAPALLHGKRCLQICRDNAIGDFDLAFAYEAVARAHSVSGQMEKAKEYAALALAACEGIAGAEDRTYAESEIATISIT